MKVSDIIRALESLAPPSLAAEGDNVGLTVGDPSANVTKLLLCVDLTEPVLAEAAAARAGMVMSYHPVIYRPVHRVTATDAPMAYAAARRGLAVYSVHTALDAAPGGANDALAEIMGLRNCRPLEPLVRRDQCKLVAFVPPEDLSRVADAAFAAGGGRIGKYHDCAFFSHGIGAFCGGPGTHPKIGHSGEHEATEEIRLELVAARSCVDEVCAAMRAAHSYETPAIDVYPLEDYPDGCGLGRVGKPTPPVSASVLITRIKKATGLKRVLVAQPPTRGRRAKAARRVATAACCAGACGSLFGRAIEAGATFYLTGEMRHHDALAATRGGMTVVCLGHSNSERIALAHLADGLKQMLPKLKVAVSKSDSDPFEIA
ncbi:MAG TPA: Nif3-like dinuclear metal center hexameric protein [Phycisphaerae bacterium]|nr:Nif3-like dinuclear metal center hexameric protein [Phycisphaerae bacterium]